MPFERKMDAPLILSVLAAGLLSFTGVVIETAMNVTFPTLMREFGVSTSLVQWITTGYLLVLSIVIPTSSWLKSRFAMKPLFMTAAGLFLIGLLVDALAPVFPLLIAGRLLQGAGTGIALPLMFNIIMEQAPRDRLGFMVGAGMLVCALAPAVGPSVGGWVVHYFGWRCIFWFLLPVLVISLILGSLNIRQSSELTRPPFDLAGFILIAFCFTFFILFCSTLGNGTMGSAELIELVLAAAAFYFFCRHENSMAGRGKKPLLHLAVFNSGPYTLAVLALGLIQFICLALGFLIPNFSQLVQGENPFTAGCILLPGCLIGALFAPVSGRILDRLGPKRPILFGSFCIILALLAFTRTFSFTTTMILTICYCIFTVGQGLTAGNTLTYGLSCLPQELKADGNAVSNTLQQLSGAVGTAVAAAIVSTAQVWYPGDFAGTTAHGTWQAFLLLFVLAVIQFIFLFISFQREEKYRKEQRTSA